MDDYYNEKKPDKQLITKLLFVKKKLGRPFEVTVDGVSMNPALYLGDVITVQPTEDYNCGDILVYNYQDRDLLVHRLLYINEGKYYCKGDNCYRLEEVESGQIYGRVSEIRRGGENIPLPECTPRLIEMSLAVNRQWIKCGYNYKETRKTDIYKLYKKIYLKMEADVMFYQKNKEMEYIPTDENSLAVFDNESGDTHFFEDPGTDILNILEEPCDMEILLGKLCEMYADVTPDDIRGDVEGFLSEATGKKVVLVL